VVDCDTFDIPGYAIDDNQQYCDHFGLKYIDTAAAYNEPKGELTVFAINRNWEQDIDIKLETGSFPGYDFVEHIQLYSDDLDAKNSYERPDVITPGINDGTVYKNGSVSAKLKKLSWNVFRFIKK